MHPLWRPLRVLVAAALFGLMLLTVLDVVGRYVFDAPLPGAFELTELVMGIVVFSALPLATLRQKHIVVGLFDFFFRARSGRARVQQVCVNLVAMAILGFVAVQVAIEARSVEQANIVTPTLSLPVAPFAYYMAFLTGVATIVFAYLLWRYLRHRIPTESPSRNEADRNL